MERDRDALYIFVCLSFEKFPKAKNDALDMFRLLMIALNVIRSCEDAFHVCEALTGEHWTCGASQDWNLFTGMNGIVILWISCGHPVD